MVEYQNKNFRMNIQGALFFLLGLIFSQTKSQTYQGLEKMCWTNNDGKIECYDESGNWYHLNSLFVVQDSVFIYKEPVIIDNNDTIFSASDGAFYYYYGVIVNKVAYLTMYNCDYCALLVESDSITGYEYPIPKRDTLAVNIFGEILRIGEVNYLKIDKEYNIFKNKNLFYLDSNSIYRYNPKEQYELISKAIKDFLKTGELLIENSALYIGLDRMYFDKYLETLVSSRIKVDSTGIEYRFLSIEDIDKVTDTITNVFRYIEIGEIIDYWKAARIQMDYKIIVPKSISEFKEYELGVLFDYDKINEVYVLDEFPKISSRKLITK